MHAQHGVRPNDRILTRVELGGSLGPFVSSDRFDVVGLKVHARKLAELYRTRSDWLKGNLAQGSYRFGDCDWTCAFIDIGYTRQQTRVRACRQSTLATTIAAIAATTAAPTAPTAITRSKMLSH